MAPGSWYFLGSQKVVVRVFSLLNLSIPYARCWRQGRPVGPVCKIRASPVFPPTPAYCAAKKMAAASNISATTKSRPGARLLGSVSWCSVFCVLFMLISRFIWPHWFCELALCLHWFNWILSCWLCLLLFCCLLKGFFLLLWCPLFGDALVSRRGRRFSEHSGFLPNKGHRNWRRKRPKYLARFCCFTPPGEDLRTTRQLNRLLFKTQCIELWFDNVRKCCWEYDTGGKSCSLNKAFSNYLAVRDSKKVLLKYFMKLIKIHYF